MTTPPDRYAVFGHPVRHSRSPAIHAAFAAQTSQSIAYEAIECPRDGFAAAVRAFAGAGGRGCNATVPFKAEAFALASRRTPRAELAGCANVLRFDAAGWWADNSDGVGLVRDLEDNAGIALGGRDVLLVGAGGAAAGVLGPLLAARPRHVVVANRRHERAAELVRRHYGWATAHGAALDAVALADAAEPVDLVVNASASSLAGVESPLAPSVIAPQAWVVDLMYGPAARPFLAWAARHGAQVRDGLGMLVEQAAEAFAAWRGVRPATAAVLATLRAQVDAAS